MEHFSADQFFGIAQVLAAFRNEHQNPSIAQNKVELGESLKGWIDGLEIACLKIGLQVSAGVVAQLKSYERLGVEITSEDFAQELDKIANTIRIEMSKMTFKY